MPAILVYPIISRSTPAAASIALLMSIDFANPLRCLNKCLNGGGFLAQRDLVGLAKLIAFGQLLALEPFRRFDPGKLNVEGVELAEPSVVVPAEQAAMLRELLSGGEGTLQDLQSGAITA